MQVVQFTISGISYHFISKTKLGSDFIQFQMKERRASIEMIESMLSNQQIQLYKN